MRQTLVIAAVACVLCPPGAVDAQVQPNRTDEVQVDPGEGTSTATTPAPTKPQPEPAADSGQVQTDSVQSDSGARVEEEKTKRKKKVTTFSLGGALLAWPPSGERLDTEVAGGAVLGFRTRNIFGGIFALEWYNEVIFHDWEAMGAAYSWYFQQSDSDSTAEALKIALWPGLLLIPFGGANYTTGVGLVVYTSPAYPAFFFGGGIDLNLYLRLSDPDFRADFGFGASAKVGVELTKTIGFSFRGLWGVPFVHQVTGASNRGIMTGILALDLSF